MKKYTWKDLCELTGLDFQELTGEDEADMLEEVANGTYLGDEIIKELNATY